MTNDLVSIIMLSKDNGQYVKETIGSVLAQTYQNWELIFLDDKSKDNTIRQMMDYIQDKRFKISQNSQSQGSAASMNSALSDARGRWIAFLNIGDMWDPMKLETQITFMEVNGYAFSYTKYRYIDMEGNVRGDMMGGLDIVTHKDLIKCCWMGYLTVMYDADKLGRFQVRNINEHNDFALWMEVSEKAECYLLPECLASHRVKHGLYSPLPMFDKVKWRYEVFHTAEGLNPVLSLWMTVRNMLGGFMKKVKYVEIIKK